MTPHDRLSRHTAAIHNAVRALRSRLALTNMGRGSLGAALLAVLAISLAPAAAGAATSPSGRVYEMVSPLDKNGADIMGDPSRTQVAVDGNAVSFSSTVGFGDTAGSALVFQYMAVRSGDGWRSHALMPAQQPTMFPALLRYARYQGEFSADLSKGTFFALSPLSDVPAAAGTPNLYLREDLRTPGPGSYRLLTVPQVPVPPFGTTPNDFSNLPTIADASSDFSHVIFESRLNLTPEADGNFTKLYEWVDGSVRLAGILPNGQPARCSAEPGSPVCSAAGLGAASYHRTPSTISRDGSRVFFTSPVTIAGDKVLQRQIYMRQGGVSTAHISAPERDTPEAEGTNTFWDASADGSKVFFTSSEGLVEDDNDTSVDVYEYDASKPASDPHNLRRLSFGADSPGVIGASRDGAYVYFVARAQFLPGAPPLDGRVGLYVAHAGTVRYIGSVPLADETFLTGETGLGLSPVLARVSDGGQRIVFWTRDGAGLTGYPHAQTCGDGSGHPGPCGEVYAYDAQANGGAGELFCASCAPDGAPASSGSHFFEDYNAGVLGPTEHEVQALTGDGERLFFMTRKRLLAADRNGVVQDVYQYDLDARRLSLVTSGEGSDDAYFLEASPSGDDVFFGTRERLVARDTDRAFDIYDARVGGDASFGAAGGGSVGECGSDSCQGPVAGAPGSVVAPTVGFRGGGNVKATRRVKAGRPARCRGARARHRSKRAAQCRKRAAAHRRQRAAARGAAR
jgi:hypothetical protein